MTSSPVPGLAFDHASRRAELHGSALLLSVREYDLLAALAAEPDRVFTKHELLRSVYGRHPRLLHSTRALDADACRLRRKLTELANSDARWIENVWGVGYRLLGPC